MEVKEIPIAKITGSLCRMRLEKDYEHEELLASIRKSGVQVPIRVKKVKGGYLVFAGHRRLDCARELKFKTIPAEIWEGISDREAAMKGFVENINRKDFTPLEEANAYFKLYREYKWSVEETAEYCGKNESRVYALMTLKETLPARMEKAIVEGKMSVGHAMVLLRFADKELMWKLFKEVLEEVHSVRDLEYILKRQKPDEEKNEKEKILDIAEDAFDEDKKVRKLRDEELVRIYRSRRGIKTVLDSNGPAELEEMLESLLAALRGAAPRFRKVVGSDGIIP